MAIRVATFPKPVTGQKIFLAISYSKPGSFWWSRRKVIQLKDTWSMNNSTLFLSVGFQHQQKSETGKGLPLKSIYSEKASKFCEIFPLLLTYVSVVKSKEKISQIFVAFSEYMNFNTYTGRWNVWGWWILTGNQGNHQNFVPSLISKNLWLISMGMKQFFFSFFFEKKVQNGWLQKNWDFQNRQFSRNFWQNFRD